MGYIRPHFNLDPEFAHPRPQIRNQRPSQRRESKAQIPKRNYQKSPDVAVAPPHQFIPNQRQQQSHKPGERESCKQYAAAPTF